MLNLTFSLQTCLYNCRYSLSNILKSKLFILHNLLYTVDFLIEQSITQNTQTFQVVLVVKNPPAKAGNIQDTGSIPESGRSSGGGHGNPFQYSCLRIPWMEEPGGLQGHKELDTTEAT